MQITACWNAPSTGCVDDYVVMLGLDGASDDMEGWSKEVSMGECVTFKQLAPATHYRCAVQVRFRQG